MAYFPCKVIRNAPRACGLSTADTGARCPSPTRRRCRGPRLGTSAQTAVHRAQTAVIRRSGERWRQMPHFGWERGILGLRLPFRPAPVTPEAAGSSPVAPVSSVLCRRVQALRPAVRWVEQEAAGTRSTPAGTHMPRPFGSHRRGPLLYLTLVAFAVGLLACSRPPRRPHRPRASFPTAPGG